MKKYKRSERVAAIIKILSDHPNELITLTYFCELFSTAKSSISEDVTEAKAILEHMELGRIETVTGVAGGARYLPIMSQKEKIVLLDILCRELRNPQRILPADFLYTADVLYEPKYVVKLGQIFAEKFLNKKIDCVATIETRGITLAMMTARALNVPLIVARNENKVTEGTTISVNYLSFSEKKVETMYLSKRSLKEGDQVLIIDDFMKAGATTKGMISLIKEFRADVVGVGVFIESLEPTVKSIGEYTSLLMVEKVEYSSGEVKIYPTK